MLLPRGSGVASFLGTVALMVRLHRGSKLLVLFGIGDMFLVLATLCGSNLMGVLWGIVALITRFMCA